MAIFSGVTVNFYHETTDFSIGANFEYRLPIGHRLSGVGLFVESVMTEQTEILNGFLIFIHSVGGLKIFIAQVLLYIKQL